MASRAPVEGVVVVSRLCRDDEVQEEQEQRHDDGTTWVLTAAAAHWESAATFLLAVITCWRTVRWDVGEQEQWSRAPQP